MYYRNVVLCLFFLLIFSIVIPSNAHAATIKKSTIKFSNGAVYFGEVKDGKPSGKGTMTYSKGKTYEGSWLSGKRSGYGKYTLKTVRAEGDSSGFSMKDQRTITYIGNWSNDKHNGTGLLTDFSSFREFGDGQPTFVDYSLHANKGTFKEGSFTKGYIGYYSKDFHSLSYFDSNINILMSSEYLARFDLSESFIDAFGGSPGGLNIDFSKKNNNQTTYMLSLSDSAIKEGIFNGDKQLSGLMIDRNYDITDNNLNYNLSRFENADIIEWEAVDGDYLYENWKSYGEKFMKFINPYMNGFKEINKILELGMI